MEIKLELYDHQYGENLLNRLLILDSGNIFITDSDCEEYDVLITDNKEHISSNKTVFLSDSINYPISIYSSSSIIYEEILRVFERNTGKKSFKKLGGTKVIGFVSPIGGCGVSSISITFSRELRLTGRNVMYITCTSSYYEPKLKESYSKVRLDYDLFKKEKLSLDKYVSIDNYSLSILEVASLDNINHLLEEISSVGKYEYIVIDYGSNTKDAKGDTIYMVISDEDLRSKSLEINDNYILIKNKCMELENFSKGYYISNDKKSFYLNKIIEILPDAKFSKSINKIMKDYLNEY